MHFSEYIIIIAALILLIRFNRVVIIIYSLRRIYILKYLRRGRRVVPLYIVYINIGKRQRFISSVTVCRFEITIVASIS